MKAIVEKARAALDLRNRAARGIGRKNGRRPARWQRLMGYFASN
jgi:hypothetical protein